ncbi:major facilitator superfamily domain-containing protein [Chiua virens]|nr:major facilitator superfamily domain-containing protein [Chiua virens]
MNRSRHNSSPTTAIASNNFSAVLVSTDDPDTADTADSRITNNRLGSTSSQSILEYPPSPAEQVRISPTRAICVRTLALLCACSLSIGSHYASYTLAPLKSRLSQDLGTSNTEFSLLISAFSLNSTWTPLVGGVLVSKLGTTLASILATGVVFLGQLILLVGETQGSVRLMTFGLWTYGLGLSPLAVVQESIIVRFFYSHGLGMSMAMGLVAGKFASFLSARTSYPLSVTFGRHAPFYVAAALTGFSFIMNLVYMSASHWLIAESGTVLEASEAQQEARRRAVYSLSEAKALEKAAKKRRVNLKDVPLLGDVFWAYIGLNVLCGVIWSPFTHLAANMLEKRYHLNEADASMQASYLLAGSIILYPVSGYLIDRINNPRATIRMFMLSSLLTMLCYVWLAAPPEWTRSPLPGIISFAGGVGFSPLLLVVIVPTIVPLKYVATTLGVHKALEHTGSTIFQTLAGVWLDNGYGLEAPERDDAVVIQHLLYALVFLNALQLISLEGLARLNERRRGRDSHPYCPEDLSSTSGDSSTDASTPPNTETFLDALPVERAPLLLDPDSDAIAWDSTHNVCRASEKRRGRIYTWLSGLLICTAWVLFLSTAWLLLRSREERDTGIMTHVI